MNANDLISQWMGRECTCEHEVEEVDGADQITTYWGNCAMHGNGGVPIPWQTSDRLVIDLLSVLEEKKYHWVLNDTLYGGKRCKILNEQGVLLIDMFGKTVAQTVTSGILELIEGEKS